MTQLTNKAKQSIIKLSGNKCQSCGVEHGEIITLPLTKEYYFGLSPYTSVDYKLIIVDLSLITIGKETKILCQRCRGEI